MKQYGHTAPLRSLCGFVKENGHFLVEPALNENELEHD